MSGPPPRTLGAAEITGEWQAPRPREHLGRTVSLEPLDLARHGDELYAAAVGVPGDDGLWDYLAYGPFADVAGFRAYVGEHAGSADPMFFAFRTAADGLASGVGSMMRIAPAHGVAEIGHIWFAPRMQRTTASTEALYLMMRHLLGDLRYRRLEWKCNALNAASRAAALRLGFRFEGIFHQHMVVKGRNRDTAWLSVLDSEWPRADAAFGRWLDPSNFDADGRQRTALAAAAGGPERAG